MNHVYGVFRLVLHFPAPQHYPVQGLHPSCGFAYGLVLGRFDASDLDSWGMTLSILTGGGRMHQAHHNRRNSLPLVRS